RGSRSGCCSSRTTPGPARTRPTTCLKTSPRRRTKATPRAGPHREPPRPATPRPPQRARKVASGRMWPESRCASAAAPTEPPQPQLARLVESPPEGEQWLHELKWDGYRLLASVHAGEPCLWSRNGLDWTARVPEVRDALATLGLGEALLDGELVGGQGRREDFNLLQQVLSGERQGRLRLVLFDLIHLDGVDLSGSPLLQRKQLLEALLRGAPDVLGYSSHGVGDGRAAFQAAQDAGFEGIISKRASARYHPGRGDDWRK